MIPSPGSPPKKRVKVPFYQSLNLRIGATIALGILTTSTLVAGAMMMRATERHEAERVVELKSSANVLAASLSAAIADKDRAQIERVLRSIGYSDQIKAGEVFDITGHSLASMGMQPALIGNTASADREGPLKVSVDVRHGGQVVGTIRLVSVPAHVGDEFFSDLRDTILWGLLAALIGASLAIMQQRRMLRPLEQLASTMTGSVAIADVPPRTQISAQGEVGLLVDSYNRMIDQIETRDTELARHRSNLEDLVEERTAEAHAARLVAEDATEAKSKFLATMSHEIRTPMNGVLVMAEMLAKSELPPTQRKFADVIHRSGKVMLDVLNDILDFSKGEAGQLKTETIPVAIDELLHDTAALFGQRAQKSGLALTTLIDSDVPAMVLGDPTRLQQCLSNLVGNAIKFTSEGAVIIEVSWQSSGEQAGQLTLAVRDTGRGIPQHRQRAIFESFAQADSATTREHGGTGLGLMITKQLVDAMGGSVSVQSNPGEGSCFTIELPMEVSVDAPALTDGTGLCVDIDVTNAYDRDALTQALKAHEIASDANNATCRIVSPDVAQTSPNDLPTVTLCPLGAREPIELLRDGKVVDILRTPYNRQAVNALVGRIKSGVFRSLDALQEPISVTEGGLPQYADTTVLVADDNEANREVIRSALALFGITPQVFTDGLDALDAANNGRYDLIMLDGEMPGIDGFEAARQIRSVQPDGPAGTGVPLVLFSATKMESEDAARALGFNTYLTKPFEIEQLGAILRRFCKPSHESSDVVLLTEKHSEDEQSNSDEAALARSVVRTMRQLDEKQPGALRRVFEACIVALPDECDHVEMTWRAGDAEQLRQAAQSLRSISSTVGATRLAALTKEIADTAVEALDRGEQAVFDSAKFDATRFAVEEAAAWLQIEIDQASPITS